MDFRRYAIFVTPRPGPLADASASWLGWDAATGVEVPHPEIDGLPCPIANITAMPRRYGFHGTIKPPFHLAAGTDRAGLAAAFESLCDVLAPVILDGLEVAALGRILALRPVGSQDALADLAARVVAELDAFRAPPGPDELARRRRAGLSAVQDAMLVRWGYPYVMSEFRYHMTLSGPLDPDTRSVVLRKLTAFLRPHLPRPFTIGDLTLLGEAEDGRFRQIARADLRGEKPAAPMHAGGADDGPQR